MQLGYARRSYGLHNTEPLAELRRDGNFYKASPQGNGTMERTMYTHRS